MRRIWYGTAVAVGSFVLTACGTTHRSVTQTEHQGVVPGFLTSAEVRRAFRANGIKLYVLSSHVSLYGDIPSLGFRGLTVVAVNIYPDTLTARYYGSGNAGFNGKPGRRVQVRNVVVWTKPGLPVAARRRVASAVAMLKGDVGHRTS